MSCALIRDLMPLCADGVASEESRAAVEEHIRSCNDCRALYMRLRAPVEVSTDAREVDCLAAMKRQKKENRRFLLRLYGITLAVMLLLLLIWPGRLLLRGRAWMLQSTAVSRETVEKEMPQALLTRDEKDLAQVIFTLPAVQTALAEETDNPYGHFPEEDYRELLALSGADPETQVGGYATILGSAVVLDYHDGKYRVILEYLDADASGHTDLLRKTTSRIPENMGEEMTELPDIGDFFSAEINAALIGTDETDAVEELHTTYEKHFEKRQWLYGLRQLFEKDD